MDKNGGEAPLPENVTWTVADAKSGTIDANGLFTPAKNYKGDVTARLLVDGVVKGTTTAKIADVTDVHFSSTSVSLDFGGTSDLGLVAKSDGVDIVYKAGDFDWTIKSKTDGVSDKDVGHMDGNTFVAGHRQHDERGCHGYLRKRPRQDGGGRCGDRQAAGDAHGL